LARRRGYPRALVAFDHQCVAAGRAAQRFYRLLQQRGERAVCGGTQREVQQPVTVLPYAEPAEPAFEQQALDYLVSFCAAECKHLAGDAG
jgi:hypothetical protein